MRIESALAVRRVKTKGEFSGDIWLDFERLTCVPVQTRVVEEALSYNLTHTFSPPKHSRKWYLTP
ncbi:hypothetical protein BJ138DRAFT_1158408 [Hygrophoropsis aurantiaca]|uniref:Uncharacterized protein n=1 Tax=Hygrophoropsis aurantiaca TaxID=72124 RepID=A0ACB8A4H3_9AGAM|nr:hypothetical protein BJ138DRAFT_1158408 [Hygrophoropsis aurantiaca]